MLEDETNNNSTATLQFLFKFLASSLFGLSIADFRHESTPIFCRDYWICGANHN